MKTRFLITVCSATLALTPIFASAEGKKVVGRVGQVVQASKVYTRASMRSGSYFRVKTNEKLVVQPNAPAGWLKVLLTNGKYGYIPSDNVEILAYEVTAENQPAPRPRSSLNASRGSTTPRGTEEARAWAAEKGTEFQGTPYVWGGNDIQNGIDCSGFVQQLYGAIGVNLPRTAAEQALVGKPITRYEDLRKGDRLYFWDSKRGRIGHTGIYLANWKFVHSSSTHRGVATDDIREKKWLNILMSARR